MCVLCIAFRCLVDTVSTDFVKKKLFLQAIKLLGKTVLFSLSHKADLKTLQIISKYTNGPKTDCHTNDLNNPK